MTPGTLGMFGIAVLLLLASAGIVAITVARRSSATTVDAVPTAEPTAFVAIVETPYPTPITPTVVPTPRASATPRLAASPATPEVARTTTAVSAGVVGSGQSKAARGVAGSMAVTLGGVLPPAQIAGAPSTAPANPIIGTNPTPTPTLAPIPTPTATRPPVSTGGGSTGGGSTGGGSTGGGSTAPTPTRTPTPRPPTATATPITPTATATVTPRPTLPPLPPVAFPGPGSATHSYALTYNQTTNLANVSDSSFSYIVLWSGFSKERVDSIKGALGLTAPVEPTGDGYRVIDPAKGSLVVNNTLGSLRFTIPGQAGGPNLTVLETPTVPVATSTAKPSASAAPSVAPSAAPSLSPTAAATQTARPAAPTVTPGSGTPTATPQIKDEAAIKQATDWLKQTGLLPDGIDAGRVTRPTTAQIVVTFHPLQPGALVLGEPAITVALGSDGAVREVNYRWPNSLNPRAAQLRSATLAWADVVAGKGYLEVEQTIPATLPPNTVFKGTATVTKASIGWRLATANGTNYLVPIYVFEGMVVLDNPVATPGVAVPFRTYVQAILTNPGQP